MSSHAFQTKAETALKTLASELGLDADFEYGYCNHGRLWFRKGFMNVGNLYFDYQDNSASFAFRKGCQEAQYVIGMRLDAHPNKAWYISHSNAHLRKELK
jgi:hypothetical protein